MKKKARRTKIKIYADLLLILKAEKNNAGKIVLTRVQAKVNVPFDRLKGYISDLQELNLIEDQTSYNLTEKGREYIDEYKKILDFMERMGISDQ
jgi:predicted transcriptional regulator